MRARNIKPGFYKNEDLAECSLMARFVFPGLWMMADREGRLEYRPKRIKAEIVPYDNTDVTQLLSELETWGLIKTYEVEGKRFIWIPGFKKHQNPHINEKQSTFPHHPDDIDDAPDRTMPAQKEDEKKTEQAPEQYGASTVQTPEVQHTGTRALRLNPDSLIPDSLNPESGYLNPESKTSCPVPCETHDSEPPAPRQDFDKGEEKPDRSPDDPVFIAIPTNKSGEEFPVTESQVSEFASLYPAVDVPAELRKIRAWNISNPTHRKTRGGVLRHVNAWLSKAQNAPPGNARSPTSAPRSGTVSKVTEKNLESLRIVREMEGRA